MFHKPFFDCPILSETDMQHQGMTDVKISDALLYFMLSQQTGLLSRFTYLDGTKSSSSTDAKVEPNPPLNQNTYEQYFQMPLYWKQLILQVSQYYKVIQRFY